MKKVLLVLVLICLAMAPAFADTIRGTITFSGGMTLNTTSATTATAVNSWLTPVVTSSSLSSPNPAIGAAVTFTAPWSFNSGIASLWTVGGYTFNLTSSAISCQNNATFCPGSLIVDGIGMISGNGYSSNTMTWHFTTQDPSSISGNQVIFSFSAAQQTVPEPASILLLSAGLVGLGGLVRRRK
jgi:PEP-CTERM motif